MSYRFFLAGFEVQCDTLEELLEAAATRVADSSPKEEFSQPVGLKDRAQATLERGDASQKSKKGKQGRGPQRAWAEAKEYADKHGCTTMEARALLSKRRKEAVEKAMNSIQKS